MCGENKKKVDYVIYEEGSPPRVRGKRWTVTDDGQRIRITPACAGKTTVKNVLKSFTQDHPRVCGENRRECAPRNPKVGSPPRVRGKHSRKSAGKKSERIPPACAGKTIRHILPPVSVRDHPRVCGENLAGIDIEICGSGSPPRVRGKPRHCPRLLRSRRITPACAGKTF